MPHTPQLLLVIDAQGVTYCGESKASSLTMENVPWHRQVVLRQQISELIAHKKVSIHTAC